jgi:methyl coenzyme M reductase subunit D
MNNRIKSIEIFPDIFGKYDSIEKFPEELMDLVLEHVQENKITIRIKNESLSFMKKVYEICDKHNIRCQKYIV